MRGIAAISSYRLGDLFYGLLNKREIQLLVEDYPNTIGAQYANSGSTRDMGTMCKIVQRFCAEVHPVPREIESANVVHVRLGDVVSGLHEHERRKRPIPASELALRIETDNPTFVIGQPFFAKPSSTNYEECISESQKYLQEVLGKLDARHHRGGCADADLCAMVQAHFFVQGKGYFSQLAAEIRDYMGKPSWRTAAIDDPVSAAVDVDDPVSNV